MKANTNYEKELLERVGRENPFRVPEGYFDALPDRVMGRINSRRKRREPWRWAVAAVLAGCVACAALALFKNELGLAPQEESSMAVIVHADHMDEVLDCNMVSNLYIENYLSEAE